MSSLGVLIAIVGVIIVIVIFALLLICFIKRKSSSETTVPKPTPVETEAPAGASVGIGKTVSHLIIGLKTAKGTKQLKLDPTIYESLQKETVSVGDVIYIEANSGAVKRMGRSDAFATEFDLEAEEYVPLPKGDVHKRKELENQAWVSKLPVWVSEHETPKMHRKIQVSESIPFESSSGEQKMLFMRSPATANITWSSNCTSLIYWYVHREINITPLASPLLSARCQY